MARINSDLGTILLAVITRLVAQSLFTAECCYLSVEGADDENVAPSSGEFVCTVSPLAGNIGQEYLDGGGAQQATDFFEFVISVYATSQLDEFGHDTVFLTDATLGLLTKLRLVLKAITALDLVDGSANNVLRDPILPQGYRFKRASRGLGKFSLTCRVAFDWDLST